MAMAAAAAWAWLPPAAARRSTFPLSPFAAPPSVLLRLTTARTPIACPSPIPQKSRLVVVASAQSNFARVVQTAWRVGKDAVEAGTNLVPGSVPRQVARIGVTFAAVSVTLFLLKSVVSTALFVLAMMGLIYLAFLTLNPKEASGSRVDEAGAGGNPSEDPVEEARRIMEKYK